MNPILQFLRKRNDNKVFVLSLTIVILLILIPIIQVFLNALSINSQYYQALKENNLLRDGVITTLELILKVGILSSSIGFLLAYIMTFIKIKFQSVINILLILPLAIPVYVAAYTYTDIYYQFPILEIILKSNFFMNGSVFIYSFFLYPYVYLASKSYLSKNLTEYIESSKTLQASPFKTFFKIILPMSRPVIIGSVLFVIFETLSDFAVVEYYGVLTLSRYINISWFNQGDIHTASRFAVYVLLIMYIMISIEKFSRRNKRYTDTTITMRKSNTKIQTKTTLATSYGFLFTIITLSFILPIYKMIHSAIIYRSYISRLNLIEVISNTLQITIISIIIIMIVSIVISTALFTMKSEKKHILSNILIMGYSIPSMVLALGIYVFFIKVDKAIYPILSTIGINRLLLTSTISLIIIGYFLKFFSIGVSNLTSAYQKIDPHLLEVALTLKENKLSTMIRVNLPILTKTIIAVIVILTIDMIKDLTLVYSLRPFNFKTLSTEVYRYAGNEMIGVSHFPSLVIIIICTILIILLEEGVKHVTTKKH